MGETVPDFLIQPTAQLVNSSWSNHCMSCAADLWLSSYSFIYHNYTYTGWPHTGTARVLALNENRHQIIYHLRSSSDCIQTHFSKAYSWANLDRFSGDHKCIFVLDVKATLLVNCKCLLQSLKGWSILKKNTPEFIVSKYISPVCFWKY